MVALTPVLDELLKSLPPSPIAQSTLQSSAQTAITNALSIVKSADNRRSQWEYLLRQELFRLAETEGQALKDDEENQSYYEQLSLRLDLALTFTELEACEPVFTFNLLQDLLETQTISSCSHIFSWVESRADRLTEGMVPSKGKALILLRTLNDLLRRLSKMGSTTMFCGRISTFLSGVFPLGERSGVNLRGEYGPLWDGVVETRAAKPEEDKMAVDESTGTDTEKKDDPADENKMQVDEAAPKDDRNPQTDELYATFWSLQFPFSRPVLLTGQGKFDELKQNVAKILPVIKEATAKERAMMGSRGTGSSSAKRKREAEPTAESTVTDYFFAKFLTSPDLLELEIADTNFRRQILFQLLILLNFLLLFTPKAKALWMDPRNRSLHIDFTLEADNAKWVHETMAKAAEELRSSAPNGRAFYETVQVILEREKNWVRWKNDLCPAFDKEPWTQEVDGKRIGLFEATRDIRTKMRDPPEDWKYPQGNEALSEIWIMGFRDVSDLEIPFSPGEPKDFLKKIRLEDMRAEPRKKQLQRIQESRLRAAALAATPATPVSAPEIVVDPPAKEETKPEPPAPKEETPSPKKISNPISTPVVSSPLHPSLPAKPGSISPAPAKLEVVEQKPAELPPPPVKSPAPPAPVSVPAEKPVEKPVADDLFSKDEQLKKFEENKQRWAWLALRSARESYLHLFPKIGTGDVELLVKAIEAPPEEKKDLKMTESVDSPSLVGLVTPAEEKPNELVLNNEQPDVQMEGPGS